MLEAAGALAEKRVLMWQTHTAVSVEMKSEVAFGLEKGFHTRQGLALMIPHSS